MRVTQNTLFNNLRLQLQANSQRLMDAQETVATQKSFNSLSDNPIAGGQVLSLSAASAQITQYLSNIDRANSLAGAQDSALDQVNTLIGSAKSLLLAESNDATSTTATREASRLQIADLTSQMVQTANTQFDGRYIFSGFATDTPAFSDSALTVSPPAIPGRAAVSGQHVADPTQMTYDNYQIQFTTAGQFNIVDTTSGATIAANQTYSSGTPIRFDGLELTLTDGPGAPQAGDTYTIATAAPGTYQGDGNVQEVDIQPGMRTALNIPGDRVFQGAGTTGGVDVFSLMNQINTALRTNDRTAISGLLDQLDTAQTQVSNERASVGGRVNLLSAAKNRQTDIQTNLDTQRSNLEDVDVADAMTNLSQQQNLYEATLAASSKIVQPSLLDFLK